MFVKVAFVPTASDDPADDVPARVVTTPVTVLNLRRIVVLSPKYTQESAGLYTIPPNELPLIVALVPVPSTDPLVPLPAAVVTLYRVGVAVTPFTLAALVIPYPATLTFEVAG
jgi:hypothetical protein